MSDGLRRGHEADLQFTVGVVVLAAGSGSRMGHKPKCLLEVNGVSMVRRLLKACMDAGVSEQVVVLGHHAERIAQELQELPVTLTVNPDIKSGRASSLKQGLKALPSRIDAVLVALADQPLIHSQEIIDLVKAYRVRPPGCELVQPSVDGLPGNPVMFSPTVREEILAGGAGFGCRQWQAVKPLSVQRWVTPNRHYRTDVDTPGDIEALEARTGLSFRWPVDLMEST